MQTQREFYRVEKYTPKEKIALPLQNAILRTVMLQPVPLMLFAAVYLVEKDELQSGNALWLIIAAQFVIAAVVWSILWVFFCLALWGVPVLWMSHPNMSLWICPCGKYQCLRFGCYAVVYGSLWECSSGTVCKCFRSSQFHGYCLGQYCR